MKTMKWAGLAAAPLMVFALSMSVNAQTAATDTAMPNCKDGTTSTKAGKGACSHHGGVAKAGAAMAAPAAAAAAPAAAAPASAAAASDAPMPTCKDGTTSTKAGKGACSHHGGVAKAGAAMAVPAAAAAAPATAPTPTPAPAAAAKSSSVASAPAASKSTSAESTDPTNATAKCKDGTYSHSAKHSGSCSHHGGVSEFLTPAAK